MMGLAETPFMETFEEIQCPFCGTVMETSIDTSIASQSFTTDCEVCCRPFQVRVQCEPGAVVSLDISGS
jgi:transcription elongation factor Elf1